MQVLLQNLFPKIVNVNVLIIVIKLTDPLDVGIGSSLKIESGNTWKSILGQLLPVHYHIMSSLMIIFRVHQKMRYIEFCWC